MDIKERIESIENFKKRFKKEEKEISYEEFNKYFYADTYFYTSKIPYLEERFYEIIFEIAVNILKSYLQEAEYYLSMKPQTIQTNSDLEIISKENENKNINKYYLELHILYKLSHKLYIEGKRNSSEIIEYNKKVFAIIKQFGDYSATLQEKFIDNLQNKLEDLNNEEKQIKIKYESSIYN